MWIETDTGIVNTDTVSRIKQNGASVTLFFVIVNNDGNQKQTAITCESDEQAACVYQAIMGQLNALSKSALGITVAPSPPGTPVAGGSRGPFTPPIR